MDNVHIDNVHIGHLVQYSDILAERLKEIISKQIKEIENEVKFRDTVKSTNDTIQWCVIIQTLVFCILGAWQIYSVRKFFVRRGII